LILIEDMREVISQGTPFRVRYDLVRGGDNDRPIYQCVYEITEDDETIHYTLVRQKPGPYGAQPREFGLYPGLLRHHREFGGGGRLCISVDDWSVRVMPRDEDAAEEQRRRKG
jgi:hypothetical protein